MAASQSDTSMDDVGRATTMGDSAQMPHVSVVVASYQSEKYIAQAIESVLGQGLDGVEVLVQDDASTDRTAEIASSYSDRGVRVRVNGARLGPVASFNSGIAATRAPLVVKLDADDWLLPGHLAECERLLREHPECVLAFTQGRVHREGKIDGVNPDWPRDRVLKGRDFFLSLLRACVVSPNCAMFRRVDFAAVGGFRDWGFFLPAGDDWDLWLRLCTRGAVAYLARPLAVYRIHGGSWTASLSGAQLRRRPFRVLAEAMEGNARTALGTGFLQREDWPVVARLLARRWMWAADACAFLPEDRGSCFSRAWRLSPCAALFSSYSWRLLAKLVLGLRLTGFVRSWRVPGEQRRGMAST